MMRALQTALVGAFLGAGLGRIGFSSWDEVHRMFVFADLRLLLTFAAAVPLLALAFQLCMRARPGWIAFRQRPAHKGTLLGGGLFGVGWALSGACPSIVFVQLGEGQLGALWTLAGMFAGNYLCGLLQQRYVQWDSEACFEP